MSITATLVGFEADESIDITLVFGDGSTVSWGSVSANAGGIGSAALTHDGLASGTYAVLADGGNGGKASAALTVK